MFEVERAADERLELFMAATARDVEAGVLEVSDAWREPEPEEVHEAKDVIGESVGVGVMLFDTNVGLVIEQAIENVARVADADVHDLEWNGAYLSEMWV